MEQSRAHDVHVPIIDKVLSRSSSSLSNSTSGEFLQNFLSKFETWFGVSIFVLPQNTFQ